MSALFSLFGRPPRPRPSDGNKARDDHRTVHRVQEWRAERHRNCNLGSHEPYLSSIERLAGELVQCPLWTVLMEDNFPLQLI